MVRYIKAATEADVKAKLDKKLEVIDKKKTLIEKRTSAIQKTLDKVSNILTEDELQVFEDYINYAISIPYRGSRKDEKLQSVTEQFNKKIKVNYWYHSSPKSSDEVAEAISKIDDYISSIQNARDAITDAQGVVDKYQSQIDSIKKKSSVLDEIPDSLKDFRASLVDSWNNYDIDFRDESKPVYDELKQKANATLYKNGMSMMNINQILRDLYPDTDQYRRETRFEKEYIETPFQKQFGRSTAEAKMLWDKSDEEINADNTKDANNLILNLINRVSKYTGEITSWNHLYVTAGNSTEVSAINGIVEGVDGKAKVESITAGGYNIQRLHIRILVKEVK